MPHTHPLRLLGALALLAAMAAAPLADARAADKPETRIVRYGDLDLTTPHGAHVLYARIREAARSVCGEIPYDLFPSPEFKACVNKAIDSAVADVDRPILSDYAEHVRRAHRPLLLAGR
jgi:UrcA family protein